MLRQAFVLLSTTVLSAAFALLTVHNAQADAVNFERQAITVALTQEPPNLNNLMSTDLVSFFVIGHTQEGLIRYDRRGRIVPGLAESWQKTAKQIVFNLRKDAKWSDGSAVTAHDFVFAWQTLNDPKTAAPYASIMRPIKNAEAIQKGELPPSELGARAADDFTLVVDLERPCGYCITVMNHGAFYPVKQTFYEAAGGEYGAEYDRLLYNGPFKLVEWVHGARLKMVKNEHYWNRNAIQLEEINVGYITEDNRTRLNLFRDGSIALARMGADTVEDASAQGMRLRTFVSGGMAYVRFNHTETSPMSDLRLRRAVQLVFDTDEFVNKVIGIPGYKTAHSFFPSWLNGVDDKFSAENPIEPISRDIPAAKALMAEIEAETGSLPAVTMLTTTSPTGVKIAEYFQGLLKQHLDLDVKVDQQTFKQYLDKVNRQEFDLSLASWYPDFDDVVTYADLLASYNDNNSGKFNDPEYDRILEILTSSDDPTVRMAAANDLQKIIQDEVAVIPTAETGSAYLQHPKLRGVVRRVLGADPDYTFARVVE
jgi:oligopeptide transport system substrate-binding protein